MLLAIPRTITTSPVYFRLKTTGQNNYYIKIDSCRGQKIYTDRTIEQSLNLFSDWLPCNANLFLWGQEAIVVLYTIKRFHNIHFRTQHVVDMVNACNQQYARGVDNIETEIFINAKKFEQIYKNLDIDSFIRHKEYYDAVNKYRKNRTAALNNRNNGFFKERKTGVIHKRGCYLLKQNIQYELIGSHSIHTLLRNDYSLCPECLDASYIADKKAKYYTPYIADKQIPEYLKMACCHYGFKCKIIDGWIFLRTNISSWYFDFKKSNIILYHENYEKRKKRLRDRSDHHRQHIKFSNPFFALRYIYDHDRVHIKRLAEQKELEENT